MAISLVLPDKYDRHCFYLRYHDMMGVHDLFFKRVDRDRNLWSDGLFEFIEKLREYLEKHPEATTAGMPSSSRGAGDSGEKHKSKSSRKDDTTTASGEPGSSRVSTREGDGSRSPRGRSGEGGGRRGGKKDFHRHRSGGGGSTADLLGDKRRILSPRQTAADESVRPRASVLKGRMAQGVMYDGDDVERGGAHVQQPSGARYTTRADVEAEEPHGNTVEDDYDRGEDSRGFGVYDHRDGRSGTLSHSNNNSSSSCRSNSRHTEYSYSQHNGTSVSNSASTYKKREQDHQYDHEEEEPLLLDQA